MMKLQLALFAVTGILASAVAAAQVDTERLEAAKRRLAEKQRASTQPSSTTKSTAQPPTTGGTAGNVVKRWRAKPDGSEALRSWLAQLPERRNAEVERLTSRLASEREMLAREEADLKRIHRRRLEQVRFRGSLRQWQTKDSPRDAARRRADVKKQQAVVASVKANIATLRSQ